MPQEASYFSRFALKFIEIFAAGVATAVSGYLIAHLGGFLPSSPPVPVAVQTAPVSAETAKSAPALPQPASAAGVAQHEGNATGKPARTTVNATQAAVARKHKNEVKGETKAEAKAEAKEEAKVEAKGETPAGENKPHGPESVEAQVRAALANVDSTRPAPIAPETPPRAADNPPAPSVAAVPQRADEGATGTVAVAPGTREGATSAVAVVPPTAEPAPQPLQLAPPVQPEPLTTVEIKSRPIAAVEAPPGAEPGSPNQPSVQKNAQAEAAGDPQADDRSLLSAIKRIPDLLRPQAPAAAAGEAPRPPMPVGEQ